MKNALKTAPSMLVVALFTIAATMDLKAQPIVSPPEKTTPPASADRMVWDLTPLFSDDDAWYEARNALLADLPRLAKLKGTLGKSAASLRGGMDQLSAAGQRVERLLVYASMQQSTDNRDRRRQERMNLISTLIGQYTSAIAWVEPEVQALGDERVKAFVKAEPGLKNHAERLRNILRRTKHTLSPQTESALAALAPVRDASGQTRTLLVDADIVWPEIMVDGKLEKVNDAGYERLRQHSDRNVRQRAMNAFFGQFAKYESTFGATLNAAVQAGTIEAKLRNYESAASAALAAEEVPEAVLRALVTEAHKGLPVLHRYFKLRQRMLKLPDLHYHDIYPPLVELKRRYTLDDAIRLTREATKPLGDEYQALLAQATSARSMHVRPADGKSGVAYSTSVYGLIPYVFLNHQDDFESVSTFAHEWGHAIHTMLADKAQPYETARYPNFIGEVAAITNEILLSQHMLDEAKTREERLFQLGYALELLRATFFRQTMFAEFELLTHDAVNSGQPLSGTRITEIYCGLLRRYHGVDEGVMQISPLHCQEWAYIPHFYWPFNVYQYATSIAAAQFFADAIQAGRLDVRDKYLEVLKSGGSAPPSSLLNAAGLDMASPTPYKAVMQRMGRLIDEIETLLDGNS